MKKFFSLFLAVLMALSLSVTAFAATGSITIKDNPNDPGLDVAGKTFNAYKVLDLVVEGTEYTYTVPAAMKTFFADRYTIAVDDQYFNEKVTAALNNEINATDFDGFAFAADLLAGATAAGVAPATVTAGSSATSVTFSNLPMGYYVIQDVGKDGDDDTALSALLLDNNTNVNPEITIKGSMPTITKDIHTSDAAPEDDGAVNEKKPYNNSSIGETVPYILTSKVPTNMDGYKVYTYIIHDEMSKGITFQNDVVVKVGNTTLAAADYTVTTAPITAEGEYKGGTAITIELKDFLNKYKNQPGADIIVTYSGVLNENAVIGEVLGNPNQVRLEYSNNPNVLVDPDDPTSPPDSPNDPPYHPTGTTPWDEVRTYVTEVMIIKTDANGNRLVGAEFELTGQRVVDVVVETLTFTEDANGTFWQLKDGTYTETDPSGEGVDNSNYVSTTVKYTKSYNTSVIKDTVDVHYTGTTNDEGILIFSGLGSGNYVLTETKAPDGYNMLKDPIGLTVSWAQPAENDDTHQCTWTYAWQNASGLGGEVTIVNNIGTVLPETGGMGTQIFYLVGGILVVGAIALLITKKRMGRED